MKRFFTCVAMLSMLLLGLAGCSDTSSSKKETTVTTPGGSTTVTTETEIKQTGDNPPPVNP